MPLRMHIYPANLTLEQATEECPSVMAIIASSNITIDVIPWDGRVASLHAPERRLVFVSYGQGDKDVKIAAEALNAGCTIIYCDCLIAGDRVLGSSRRWELLRTLIKLESKLPPPRKSKKHTKRR